MERKEKKLPFFQLPSTDGRTTGPRAFWQRRHLLVVALPDVEAQFGRKAVERLNSKYALCREREGEVLVVAGGEKEKSERIHREIGPSFPFLFDEDGAVCSKLLEDRRDHGPAILVVDRFGTVWSEIPVSEKDDPEKVVDRAFEELEFVNLQCPECGVPDTPPPSGE